jgi:malate permease and related proteins
MPELKSFFMEIPVLLILAAAGFVLYKMRLIDPVVLKGISGIVIYFAMPSSILISFIEDINKDIFRNFAETFLISGLIYIFFMAVSTVIFSKKNDESIIAKLSLVFSNCAFIGIPIISSLFGQEGIVYTSIFILYYNIFIWTYGVKLLQSGEKKGKGFLKVLLNPGIIAMCLGFIFAFFGFELPYYIERSVRLAASLTTPLAMILVGAMFAGMSLKEIFLNKKINLISFIRLLLIPIFLIFVFKLIGLSGTHIKVMVILAAMPVATTVAILAEQFNRAPSFASGIIGYSTLLSVLTVPVVFYLLNIFL